MQPAEIVWRARSVAMLPLDWAQWKNQPAVPVPSWAPLDPASYPVKLHQSGTTLDRIHIFDLEFPVGFEFDWHRDYRYGRQVERSFAGTLNIRDTAVVSDIKYVWEPSRFQLPLSDWLLPLTQRRCELHSTVNRFLDYRKSLSVRRALDQQPRTGRASDFVGYVVSGASPIMSRAMKHSVNVGSIRFICT